MCPSVALAKKDVERFARFNHLALSQKFTSSLRRGLRGGARLFKKENMPEARFL
jgi:hypothetical protein